MGLLDPVVEKLNSIGDTLTEMLPLIVSISENQVAITTNTAGAKTALDAIDLKLDDVRALFEELKNSGVPAEELNAILTKLTGMQADVTTAQTSLGEIKTASDSLKTNSEALKTTSDAVKSEADSIE